MINAADNTDNKDHTEIDTTIDHRLTHESSIKWHFTDVDIVAQAFIFLFAGHETTATTLTFSCYLLALNQDVQEKAFKEISDLVGTNEVNII